MGQGQLSAWNIDARAYPYGAPLAERLRFLLGYAVLAPSGHNSQPWRFRIEGDSVEVHEDRSRSLPVADPQCRELVVSCGGALQFLLIAMRRFGLEPAVELEPAGPGSPCLARVTVADGGKADPESESLVLAMTRRRSNRLTFEQRSLSGQLVVRLQAGAQQFGAKLIGLPSGPEKEEVASLVEEATRVQFADPAFRAELAGWMTTNGSRRGDGMPGYALGLNSVSAWLSPRLVRRFDPGQGQSRSARQLVLDAPLLVLLTTARDDRVDALNAGRALAVVLLRARIEGVWASFFNQPLQLPILRRRLSRMVEDEMPQLLFRLGHGPDVRPTPRRAVAEVLL